jgi:hypothetical protein
MIKLWEEDIKRLLQLKIKGTLEEKDLLEMEDYYTVTRFEIITCLTVAEMRSEIIKKIR